MRTAVVTGASSGIGTAVALELARIGFHVMATGRSEERTMPVVEAMRRAGGSAEFTHLDLSSLSSTRMAAEAMAAAGREIQVLVNNAGVGLGRGVTSEGFEIHFGVNHLGHFLLTDLLSPAMAPGARVVTVASAAHHNASGIDFNRVRGRTRSLLGWREYAESKLANVLFNRELARRRPELSAYAVHPGLVDTGIIPRWGRPFIRRRLLTAAQGADTVVWCCLAGEVADETGLYYWRHQTVEPSPTGQGDDLAIELWERSAAWCADGLGG